MKGSTPNDKVMCDCQCEVVEYYSDDEVSVLAVADCSDCSECEGESYEEVEVDDYSGSDVDGSDSSGSDSE